MQKIEQVFVGNLELLQVFCNFVLPGTLLIFALGMALSKLFSKGLWQRWEQGAIAFGTRGYVSGFIIKGCCNTVLGTGAASEAFQLWMHFKFHRLEFRWFSWHFKSAPASGKQSQPLTKHYNTLSSLPYVLDIAKHFFPQRKILKVLPIIPRACVSWHRQRQGPEENSQCALDSRKCLLDLVWLILIERG